LGSLLVVCCSRSVFFFFISCISFWLFALWPSQYTLDDYKKKVETQIFSTVNHPNTLNLMIQERDLTLLTFHTAI
jgi:hypothetical protein